MDVINEIIDILSQKLPIEIARKIIFEGQCISSPSCKIIKPFIRLIKEIPFDAMIGKSDKIVDAGEVIQIIPHYRITKLNLSSIQGLIDRQTRKERLIYENKKQLNCLRLFYSTQKSITILNNIFNYKGVSRILFFY
jgi:hypothetical protein